MQRLIKSACAIAAEDIGKERAVRIAQNAQKRYEALCAENAGESKALKPHTFGRIYPGIAVYETMQADGIEADRAVWYIREYFQRFSANAVPHIQRLIRFPGAAKKIPGLFLKISVRNFGEDAGFLYEFPVSSGNKARFNIVKCPYYPEAAQVMEGRKYGFNLKSQLLKLVVIFPAVSALAAWICTLF